MGDQGSIISTEVSLPIFVFLAPSVLYLVKRTFSQFKALFQNASTRDTAWHLGEDFPETQKIKYLFSNDEDFTRYRRDASRMLNDKREKYLAIGLAFGLILPLSIAQDMLRGSLALVFSSSWFSLSTIEYCYAGIYWCIVYSLLLSVVWMVVTITRSLLRLQNEKPHLHITQTLKELDKSFQSTEQKNLTGVKIGLIDLSFRRFKAGLAPIVDFAVSLSTKIAFVGMICSIPALVFFVVTKGRIMITWYGLCVFSCAISVAVFLSAQYGVWRLWSSSKKEASKLLDHVCAMKTQQCSKLGSEGYFGDSKERREIERDVGFVQRLNTDLNQLNSMTYTSSSAFKLISVNFLAFAPLILEVILIYWK